MTTAARLLPHLPSQLQRTLEADQIRDGLHLLDASGTALHLDPATYRRIRNGLDVESAERIAARASDPDVLAEVATDRRTRVHDAIATNPNLPADLARTLLDRTLAEKPGRNGNVRWQRAAHLAGRIISVEGPHTVSTILHRLADRRDNGGRRTEPMPSDILLRHLLLQADGATVQEAILDGTIARLSELGALRLVELAGAGNPWGAETTLCAIESEHGAAHLSGARRSGANLPGISAVEDLVRSMADPARAARAARTIHRIDRKAGARLIADLLDLHDGPQLDTLHQHLELDLGMLSRTLQHRREQGRTLTVRGGTVTAISTLRTPERNTNGIDPLLAGARSLDLQGDARELILNLPRTFGTDLLAIIAALRGDQTEMLTARLQQVDTTTLILGDWDSGNTETVRKLTDALVRIAGDRTTLARKICVAAEKSSRHSRDARQVETLMRRLLERRTLSIADIAENAEERATDVLTSILTDRTGPHTLRRSRRGDLRRAPHHTLVRIAAQLIEDRNLGGPQQTLLKDRALLKDDVLIPAIRRAGATTSALAGETFGDLPHPTLAGLIDAALAEKGWDRERETHNIVWGAARAIDRTGNLPWADILAEKLPLRDLQPLPHHGERQGRVEAAVLLHAVGDDTEDWRILARLADTWDGTAAELAATIRTLNPRDTSSEGVSSRRN